MTDSSHHKLERLRQELCASFFERDHVIRGALAALLAGEHILLLGPVGTAKSMLATELAGRIEGASYFGWLLTRFSTPEEVFGPISLRALEADRYERVTDGRLPQAHIAFLDEIFKSNSAILNSLLTLINERVFHNGAGGQPVPLLSLFAASNELPEEGELTALFDRFLLRYEVGYIEEDYRFIKMIGGAAPPSAPATTLTLDDLTALQTHVGTVEMDEVFLGDFARLRKTLNKAGIIASDRRYQRAVKLMKAFAVVAGRDHVDQSDMSELANVLWNDPSEYAEVKDTITALYFGHEEEAQKLLYQAREVRDYALRKWGDAETAMRASIEAHTKLSRILDGARRLLADAEKRRRATATTRRVTEEIEGLQREILAEGV